MKCAEQVTYECVFELQVFVSGHHEMHLQRHGVIRHRGSEDLLGNAPATSALIRKYIGKRGVVCSPIVIFLNFDAAQFW
jgi:hypothetical protein